MRRLLVGVGVGVAACAATRFAPAVRCADLPACLPLPSAVGLPPDTPPPTTVAALERLIQEGAACSYRTVDLDCLNAAVANYEPEPFFEHLLPAILAWARQASTIRPEGTVPVLRRPGDTASFAEGDVRAVLAAALLCRLPGRTTDRNALVCKEDPDWPSINLDSLLRSHSKHQRLPAQQKVTKLLMLLEYFTTMRRGGGDRVVQLERQAAPPLEGLAQSSAPLGDLTVHTVVDTLGDAGGALRVVPAVQGLVGTFSLQKGILPEDWLFLAAPELLLARWLCPRLKPDELLVMHGAREFTRVYYTGAEWRHTVSGPALEDGALTERDLDVVTLPSPRTYDTAPTHDDLKHDLRLALGAAEAARQGQSVAVGPWPGRDPLLAALVQWAGCAHVNRPFHYYPANAEVEGTLPKLAQQLQSRGVTVGQLVEFVMTTVEASPKASMGSQVHRHFRLS